MAFTIFRGPRVSVLWLLRFWLLLTARALEIVDITAPELSCSEGLTDCQVSSASQYSAVLPDTDDTVSVTHVKLKASLCCPAKQDCEPCLQIIIAVQVRNAEQVSEQSGERNDEEEFIGMTQMLEGSGQMMIPEPRASLKVCCSSPYSNVCKTLQFKTRASGLQTSQLPTHELLLTEKVTLGIPVVVHVDAQSNEAHHIQNITVPSLEDVCSMKLERTVKECDAPRIRAVTDHKRNVVRLKLMNTDVKRQDEIMCQMIWNGMPGEVLPWLKGKREIVISSNAVAPCLCFEVWWKGKLFRRKSCPFKDQQGKNVLERMQHNVSVSMAECQIREGGTELCWNVTAPCRLQAEVWLCKNDLAGGQCEEVTGSRQWVHDHSGWSATRAGHWKAGAFNVSSHPLLCVQMKIHGMESYLEPQCPFATSRWRWSLPLVIGLLLMCVAILGAYLIQGVLKGYMWRWLKEEDVKGAVGGGHVVLLYPPGDDQALPELMSHLGTSLQALGFTVSLDLWSQTELCLLGPVPWFHSRLNRLQKQGGKVVLVLTQAAWIRAEEWGAGSWEKNTTKEKNREGEEAGKSYGASSPCVDVFTASLSCILADYLQGRAGERFMLVQFESLPPEPPGGFRPLPELFRGLHLYSLPSQSLGFLTELAGARQMATASARRKRAGGLRMASRALARGLSGFTAGTSVLRLAGVPQSCVGVEAEDSGETMPLQPCLVTPPSSPDTSPKASEMDWV
ncbi:interleukin-17 receptor C isoform X1 [Larimichthys crocea]|uniref:interleukin-17 receptor C isoform X1 n=1 Tax=Larimichthys crocea TaxID=215358 RepID=UPI00054B2E9E|nr:interleukin-17 receptor C isoform X1 [Larimichthys crocea]